MPALLPGASRFGDLTAGDDIPAELADAVNADFRRQPESIARLAGLVYVPPPGALPLLAAVDVVLFWDTLSPAQQAAICAWTENPVNWPRLLGFDKGAPCAGIPALVDRQRAWIADRKKRSAWFAAAVAVGAIYLGYIGFVGEGAAGAGAAAGAGGAATGGASAAAGAAFRWIEVMGKLMNTIRALPVRT